MIPPRKMQASNANHSEICKGGAKRRPSRSTVHLDLTTGGLEVDSTGWYGEDWLDSGWQLKLIAPQRKK